MNKETEIYIKNLAQTILQQNQFSEKLQLATSIFEDVQNYMLSLGKIADDKDASMSIKVGTILAFSTLKKVVDGKMPMSFDRNDWKEIADSISKYAILQEEQSYTKFVFGMYESYIRSSANSICGMVSDDTVKAIVSLADELAQKTNLLDNAMISEVQYIEDCLWISLEAMLKLICSITVLLGSKEFSEFSQAIAIYALAYGRLKLLQKEQETLSKYISSQQKLQNTLEKEYEIYVEKVEKEAAEFYVLIENAFAPNFRESFLSSIVLAQHVGVDDGEILKTIDDIDGFFLL